LEGPRFCSKISNEFSWWADIGINQRNLAPLNGESPKWPLDVNLFGEIDWICCIRLVRVLVGSSHYSDTTWRGENLI